MKFFFRKFHQFEAFRESVEGVEAVKQKAAEFVESLIGKIKGEDDEKGDAYNYQKNSAIESEEDDEAENENLEKQ